MQVTRGTRSTGKKYTRIVMEIEDLDGSEGKASFLDWQQDLRRQINGVQLAITKAQLIELDTNGEPLMSDGLKWTTKGRINRTVETLAGTIEVPRHVYQTSAGGATRAPMDERAGLIGSACPEMGQALSAKIAESSSRAVMRDLEISHQRKISSTFAQDIATEISRLATQEDPLLPWEPLTKVTDVAYIVIGLDSAMLHQRADGWRAAHCATFALYSKDKKRLETLFVASGPGETAPEGKAAFFALAKRWLDKLKKAYPEKPVYGLSDAAADIKAWLAANTDEQSIDYHHVAEYLTEAAPALLTAPWAEESQHSAKVLASTMRGHLRDEVNGAEEVYTMMADHLESHGPSLPTPQREALEKAVRYVGNHKDQMKYAQWRADKRPIGSGVTEAACKVIIKQRMTQSGMRWTCHSADEILRLRALYRSPARWSAFWALQKQKTLTQGLAPLRSMKE